MFDEADMLFSARASKPLRMCFDVLYREEKLASEGFFLDGDAADETEAWDGDAERDEASFKRDCAQGSPRWRRALRSRRGHK